MTHAPVYQLLSTDSVLNDLGMTADTILGSTVAQSPEVRPFMIVKWGTSDPIVGRIGPETLEVWAYDEPGSFVRINTVLKRVYSILVEENADVVVEEERFSTAKWRGDSPELYDDIFKCATRYSTFSVV